MNFDSLSPAEFALLVEGISREQIIDQVRVAFHPEYDPDFPGRVPHEGSIESIADWILQGDPVAVRTGGKKTPFVKDIIRWFKQGTIILPEDLGDISYALSLYQKVRHEQGFERDISEFDSPGALLRELEPLAQSSTKWGTTNLEHMYTYNPVSRSLSRSPSAGASPDEYVMWKVSNWEQGKIAFDDSGWCVQRRREFNEYGPPFYLITRGNKRVALAHPQGGVMDPYDDPISVKLAEQIAPLVRRVITMQDLWREPELAITIWDKSDVEENMLKAGTPGQQAYYAKKVIKGRWPEAEETIAKDSVASFRYAKSVIKGRWPKGEEAIAKGWAFPGEQTPYQGSLMVYLYAELIKRRFYKGESYLLEHPNWLVQYVSLMSEMYGGWRWDEAEEVLLSHRDYPRIVDYAKKVIKGRWPEAEKLLQKLPKYDNQVYRYTTLVGSSEWYTEPDDPLDYALRA